MVSGRVLRRGLTLLVRSSPRSVAGLVIVQVVAGLAPTVVVAAGATLLDNASTAANSDTARRATVLAMVAVALALAVARIADAVVSMLNSLVNHRFGAAVDGARMEAVAALPGLAHFDQPDLASAIQASQWATQAGAIVNYAGYFLRWFSQAVGAAVVAARIGWWVPVLLALTPWSGAIVAWRHIGAQRALRMARMTSFRHAGYGAELAVGLDPAREVRLFGIGAWLLERQDKKWHEAMDPVMADMRRELRSALVVGAAKAIVSVIPFVVAHQRFRAGDLSAGDFSAAVIAIGVFLGAMRWLETFPAEARASAQFLPDLFALVDLAGSDPRLSVTGIASPPVAPVAGIRFEGVHFTYPGTDRPVLDGLDLWIPAGSSLALVGDNGAGKSTVVKLLCRFYDPDEGRITLDGVDLRDLDLAEWRRRMAVVFQEFIHFPLTAAANIGAGCVDRADDGALLQTAAGQAKADDVIARLPEGWDTVLAREFGGVDLSGGEWQRMALARAMAGRLGRQASVLVLDEPTAALDVRLEHDIFQRFAGLTEGLTTLLISHRFSTVRMAEAVAVLEGGRMVEHGSHDDLVAAGGRYAELYGLQARRFA
ncbi:MAG: ABC transporter ATP-binding protein [Acidimicrobiales bacterium]